MRSLRGRLALGVGLVLAAVLLAFGLIASRSVARSEREALDDRLVRTAELSRGEALAALEQELPAGDARLDAVLRATGSSLRLVVGGTTLVDTGRAPPSRPAPRPGLVSFEAGGRPYRSYTTTLDDPELAGLALLQVTGAAGPLERRLAALDRRFALLGLLALLLAGAGTWLAADLVLRPLRRLRTATSAIAGDEDLGRRVGDDRGPAELRALAADFNAMLTRLGASSADRERALEATRRFAADAGHELRTPLTSVLATLSTLRRHPDVPADRRAAMLDDALAEHRRLVALLDGLQTLARGDATPPPREDVDLAELAAQAVTEATARHPGHAFAADLPPDPVVVHGWAPGLRLVLDNLLENAARHGRSVGGHAWLTLAAAPAGVVLTVDDDGVGVAPQDAERVFEPFARAGGPDGGEGAPGTGLGLALVAQQARLHDGRVHVEASPRGGARFVLALPASPGP